MRASEPRFVYVIRSGDFAKVGSSKDPTARLAQLDKALAIAPEIVATFPSYPGLEYRLHRWLLGYHARHEWFRWCDRLDHLVRVGLPEEIHDIQRGSPFHPNRGGRKPRMVEAS